MATKVGDKLPSVTLQYLTSEGPKDVTTGNFFSGKKVVLFALPHALAAASQHHWSGYVEKVQEFRSKGIDEIACVAVQDAAAFSTWALDQDSEGKVTIMADGSGDFGRAFGLAPGPAQSGAGFSMLVEDAVVRVLNLNTGTDAATMIMHLEGDPPGGIGIEDEHKMGLEGDPPEGTG